MSVYKAQIHIEDAGSISKSLTVYVWAGSYGNAEKKIRDNYEFYTVTIYKLEICDPEVFIIA